MFFGCRVGTAVLTHSRMNKMSQETVAKGGDGPELNKKNMHGENHKSQGIPKPTTQIYLMNLVLRGSADLQWP